MLYEGVQVDMTYHNYISIYRASMMLFRITDHMYKTLLVTDQY